MNIPNHYATLGIRPNASNEEIELAFKGRRSQYHPDRYSQSESETLQWATQQMQLVNVAYRVLSNPLTRAAHDHALQQAAHRSPEPPVTSKPPRAASEPTLRRRLAEAFSDLAGFGRIYLAPDIPLKKLSGALASYGEGLDASDVLALVDDTVFGGGGDGILVTENALILKSLGDDGRLFQMKAMQALQTSKNALYVNGRKLIQLNMPDAKGVDALFGRIREFAVEKYGTADQEASSASAKRASEDRAATASAASTALPTPEQLFAATKSQFGALYRAIRAMGMDVEDPALDQAFASVALRYFELTETGLANGTWGQAAFDELGKVYLLTCNILEVMQDDAEVNTHLLRGEEGDGQLLVFLRGILSGLRKESQPEQVKRSADRYFGGD